MKKVLKKLKKNIQTFLFLRHVKKLAKKQAELKRHEYYGCDNPYSNKFLIILFLFLFGFSSKIFAVGDNYIYFYNIVFLTSYSDDYNDKLNDGSLFNSINNNYTVAIDSDPLEFVVDLGSSKALDYFRFFVPSLISDPYSYGGPDSVDIYGSNDNSNFTLLKTYNNGDKWLAQSNSEWYCNSECTLGQNDYRYLKFDFHRYFHWFTISELEIYSPQESTPTPTPTTEPTPTPTGTITPTPTPTGTSGQYVHEFCVLPANQTITSYSTGCGNPPTSQGDVYELPTSDTSTGYRFQGSGYNISSLDLKKLKTKTFTGARFRLDTNISEGSYNSYARIGTHSPLWIENCPIPITEYGCELWSPEENQTQYDCDGKTGQIYFNKDYYDLFNDDGDLIPGNYFSMTNGQILYNGGSECDSTWTLTKTALCFQYTDDILEGSITPGNNCQSGYVEPPVSCPTFISNPSGWISCQIDKFKNWLDSVLTVFQTAWNQTVEDFKTWLIPTFTALFIPNQNFLSSDIENMWQNELSLHAPWSYVNLIIEHDWTPSENQSINDLHVVNLEIYGESHTFLGSEQWQTIADTIAPFRPIMEFVIGSWIFFYIWRLFF